MSDFDLGDLVGLHDEKVGMADNLLTLDAGRTYRLFIIPQKLPLSAAESGNEATVKYIKNELAKGRAKIFKKGDAGWFGPEESYILMSAFVKSEGWFKDGKGYLQAPTTKHVRDRVIRAFGTDPIQRYGCIAMLIGTNLSGDEVMMLPGKDPQFDFVLKVFRISGVQISQLQQTTKTCCPFTRDITISTKKQGNSVRWESVSANSETLFFNDSLCSAEAREKIYMRAKTMGGQIKRILFRVLTDPEWEAMLNATSSAAVAAIAPPPTVEENLGDLLG